ncbi:MAG TPA: hypothetical protein ENL43_02260 [candidate division WOR-3 bacterium]|uniref:Magnetosome protein MamS/MamX domain-containing protein n=1 Tax=candidate division WOR-3 bacterium TaxID=2052148 RepID=A0A7V5HNF0_UNCW3|nr:hypothetical protein [candidate division WOR-3 bacterium]
MLFLLMTLILTVPQVRFYYDLENQIEIKGKIIEVGEEKGPRSGIPLVFLMVDADTDTFKIILGPPWYIEELPRRGEIVEVRGSLNKNEGERIIVAGFVKFRSSSRDIYLRDKEGFPLWRCTDRMRRRRGR